MELSLESLLGPTGPESVSAMRVALDFLHSLAPDKLLGRVGQKIESIPAIRTIGKAALQDSYGGTQTGPTDDLLAGRDMFYITEQGRLCLDCTSGHYQMTWGYNNAALVAAMVRALGSGIIWDNHCNIPQSPVKRLAERLVEIGNAAGETDRLDTVLLGCCTGSVACAAALKMQLMAFEKRGGPKAVPVIVVLEGNYHGTDMVAQNLRGMWGRYVRNIKVVAVEPNDQRQLGRAFARYGSRAAAFWAEPIMMNREAIPVLPEYLQLARRLCDETQAAMCVDEIQTGFWQPEIFCYRSLGIQPDFVIAGKGMTAGYHPQAAVLFKSRYDLLAQYDAISTNGSAPMPCYVGLCCLEMILAQAGRIAAVGDRFEAGMQGLVRDFPARLHDVRGKRHMMGLKFKQVQDALDFHKSAVAAGLWVRVHAYHAGHSTVLAKLSLAADEPIVDFVVGKCRELLGKMA